ncbi:hydroxypyruvate isomerase family protein [Haloechinothrix salitolerans]|uniref:Hydroxypyruvate isomerase family protein n=1 Tax=Haloechinothrix salitolerans TaxID=926830 RepID=A0ABW2C3J0_9PSEU
MDRHANRFAVNCSILFTELPVLERPAAAKAAGFDAVEFWWPFAEPVPSQAEQDEFVAALDDAGVSLIGLNFFAGDMPAGDRGIVSWPSREQEFRDNAAVVAALGERTGCRAFNALYGNRFDDTDPDTQDKLALDNLSHAASAVAEIGGTVLIEPVSGATGYPLRTANDAIDVITALAERGATNAALLADLYHLHVNGDDVARAIDTHADRIAHVQIADAPGRNEPGTGTLDISGYLDQLSERGYTGWIAAEYKPSGATADSFGWFTR